MFQPDALMVQEREREREKERETERERERDRKREKERERENHLSKYSFERSFCQHREGLPTYLIDITHRYVSGDAKLEGGPLKWAFPGLYSLFFILFFII